MASIDTIGDPWHDAGELCCGSSAVTTPQVAAPQNNTGRELRLIQMADAFEGHTLYPVPIIRHSVCKLDSKADLLTRLYSVRITASSGCH